MALPLLAIVIDKLKLHKLLWIQAEKRGENSWNQNLLSLIWKKKKKSWNRFVRWYLSLWNFCSKFRNFHSALCVCRDKCSGFYQKFCEITFFDESIKWIHGINYIWIDYTKCFFTNVKWNGPFLSFCHIMEIFSHILTKNSWDLHNY